MLELRESCHVPRSPISVSRYLANFATAAQWDPTTLSARRVDSGPLEIGAQFELRCSLPVGSIRVRYKLTGLEHGKLIALEGTSALFRVSDEIRLEPENGGCRIDYRARFRFRAPIEKIIRRNPDNFRAMGRETIEGLAAALRDNNPPPTPASDTQCADRWVVPGIAHFTRAGYRRGQRRWPPLSTDITGRHIVLTGVTSGLGQAAALALAEAGARLTLVARDESRGMAAVKELQVATGNSHIDLEIADLSLLREVDALIERLQASGQPVDVLINNAGALFNERGETSEGLERSYALLLLSPWRLTQGLLPLLKQSTDARVINVVSGGMYTQHLNLKVLTGQSEQYSGDAAYAQAKRGLMIATEHLASAWAEEGVTVNAMHPGWADTPGVETALPRFHKLLRPFLRDPAEGADTIIWLARAREASLVSGELFLDREPRPTHLLERTRESADERQALLELLAEYLPPTTA